MNSKEYWRKREEEALTKYKKSEAEYDKEIERIYADMLDSCNEQINAFYGKYASKEGISIAEAKKRVRELDIKEYERKAARYVRDAELDRKANGGKTNKKGYYFSPKAEEEMRLYNATMKINRLEMLKANIGLELIKGHDELDKFMGDILKGRTQEELERQAGILGKSVKHSAKYAHTIPNGSFHNATFSDRIWQYQNLMREDLSKILSSGLIQGKNPRAIAKDLKKYWYGNDPKTKGGAVYCMERLMRTEMARVQTEAQKQSFERNGFEQYEFIANSDCCDICKDLDGKHFKVKDMMPGENAAPLHPHCRCSVAAYSFGIIASAIPTHVHAEKSSSEIKEEIKEWEKKKVNKSFTSKAIASGIMQSGGKLTVGSLEWTEDRDNKASRTYEAIRQADDVEAVAKSSGMTINEIQTIKNHIFYDYHIKYDGEVEQFDPDYDMAVAWKRLVAGTPKERDLLLLKHELLENQIEKEYNITAAEAHARANKVFAWDKKLFEELGEGGEQDDLL